jgi:hypothetical protein
MAAGKKWYEIFESMSDETLKDVKHHLLGLKNVVKFADEWKDTGLFSLIYFVDEVLMKRSGGKMEYPFKCSCDWSKQASCQWSKGNGIPGSAKPEEMSDCMNREKTCAYQVEKPKDEAEAYREALDKIPEQKRPVESFDEGEMTPEEREKFPVMQKFTVLSYNPSKNYLWSMHKAGCRDIQAELKGIRTDSGFPAIDPQDIEAKDWAEAAEKWIDEELREMGWTTDAIRICPCCKGGK